MATDSEHDETLYASVDGSVYPLSAEECVFRARHTGAKHVMTLQVLKAMDICSRFRTMDGHVQAIMHTDSELRGRDQDVRRVVEALLNRGLLVGGTDTLAALTGDDSSAESAPTAGLFVRSVGRPGALGRLLEGLNRNRERYGAISPCYVLSDCREEETAAECRQLCESWRGQGLDVHWLDKDWQRDLLARLAADAGLDDGLARWLGAEDVDAGAFTGGRLWNLALLAAAGRPLIMLDDDIVPEARRMTDGAALDFDAEAWEMWFHPSAEAAAQAGEPMNLDPLAEHGRFVGRTLGNAFARLAPAERALEGLDQRRLQALSPRAPIVATVSGIHGDAASGSNFWMYALRGESLERFWASREEYEVNRNTRWLTRVRDRYCFQKLNSFTPVGLDGQVLLPPTMPFGRNEDYLFNVLLKRVHPHARTLEFPWSLGHFPEKRRPWGADARKTPRNENVALFIADNLLNLEDDVPGRSPERSLRICADQLRGLANLSDQALCDRVDEYLLYLRSDLVSTLQRRIAEYPSAPVYWAADVRAVIEANGKALSAEGLARLLDMPQNGPDGEAARWVKDQLERFAELLEAWPALWAAAREHDALAR